MKKILKKAVHLIFFPLAAIAIARFCLKETDGFRMGKISSNTFPNKTLAYSLSLKEYIEIEESLSQKYFYLARGQESFVFESPDKKYVIKLLNNRSQKRIAFLEFWTLPAQLEQLRKKNITKERIKLERAFESYKIAYEELKTETGLLFLHLTPTSHFKKMLTIVDKLGIEHQIDLDKTGFILQRRAKLAYPLLLEFKQKEELQKAKFALENLLKLILYRCKKGIADKDSLIPTNLGFIGDRPILIDAGPFSRDEKIQMPDAYVPEIIRITASLKDWINVNYPELCSHLDQQLEKMLKSSQN